MKAPAFLALLVLGLAAGIPYASGQSRFGYGVLDTEGYYQQLNRKYGPQPTQNSRFGEGIGMYGFSNSKYGLGSTRYGQQYSPFGSQLSAYGSQYNGYGAAVPQNWTPPNPASHLGVSGNLPPPNAHAKTAPAVPPNPLLTPPAPATQPTAAKRAPASQPNLPPPNGEMAGMPATRQ